MFFYFEMQIVESQFILETSLIAVLRWIGDWFKKADKNNDGRMNFKEVQDLLKMMNVDMNEQHAHRLFTVRSLYWNKKYRHSCDSLLNMFVFCFHFLDTRHFDASDHRATVLICLSFLRWQISPSQVP